MGGVILGLLRLVISHHWIGIQTAVFLEENPPTKLLRCTLVTYLLHTLFLVLYMQTKQFFKNFFFFLVLDTNTLDYDVHIYGFWLDTVDLQKLPEVLMYKKTAKTEA